MPQKHASSSLSSNGNASEAKRSFRFDNGVLFDIEAKRTHSIVLKLFSKQSEHVRYVENYFLCEANTFDSKKIIFEAKRTHSILRKFFSMPNEHLRQ